MLAWYWSALLSISAGFVGGILAHEYSRRRQRSADGYPARRELRSAFFDIQAYWEEAQPEGISDLENQNLLAAVDVLRDTLLRRSTHFQESDVQELQRRIATLRAQLVGAKGDDVVQVQGAMDQVMSILPD